MKKLFLIPLLLGVLACGSSTPEAESTVGITAPDGFSVGCAVNYIRSLPHFCATTFSVSNQEVWLETTTGCKTHTLTSVPSTTKRVLLWINLDLRASNVVSNKQVLSNLFSDASCVTQVDSYNLGLREMVATADGTTLGSISINVSAVTVSNTVVTSQTFAGGGTGSAVTYKILGYYD
jgi:hypothetical protein